MLNLSHDEIAAFAEYLTKQLGGGPSCSPTRGLTDEIKTALIQLPGLFVTLPGDPIPRPTDTMLRTIANSATKAIIQNLDLPIAFDSVANEIHTVLAR